MKSFLQITGAGFTASMMLASSIVPTHDMASDASVLCSTVLSVDSGALNAADPD